jgi:hypothetical protein
MVVCAVAASFAGATSATRLRAAATPPKLLISLGGVGTMTWRCDSRARYSVSFRDAVGGATEQAVVTRTGGPRTSRRLDPGQSLTLPFTHDHAQTWQVGFATEAVRTNATIQVTLGPVSGECIVPLTRATLHTVPNG